MIGLTFDVEERFHSHLAADGTPRRWDAGARIEQILDLLEAEGHRATFFVVGELAQHYPALIRRMVASGFEVGSHTQTHPRLDGDDRKALMDDIARSKAVLEELTGSPILGFRAPSWTARLGDEWLWDHLVALGFRYDSSLFPFRTHLYGSLRNPVRPFRLRPELVEMPPSVSRLGPLRLPYGGGFYFRLYPGWLTRRLIDRDVRARKTPVVYFHPWEFDADPTPGNVGPLSRFISNHDLAGTWAKFTDLLGRYSTRTMADLLETAVEV